MARTVALLAVLAVGGHAAANNQIPGDPGDYFKPSSVPSSDQCGVNCYRICGDGLNQTDKKTGDACRKTCWAHSIQTTKESTGVEQGKYMQKVMTEYCDRRVCTGRETTPPPSRSGGGKSSGGSSWGSPPANPWGAPPANPWGAPPPGPWGSYGWSLSETKEATEQKEQEGEAWLSSNKGPVPAQRKGWPKGQCADKAYYCNELCLNLWHAATPELGEHPGTKNWQVNQKQCLSDCAANFQGLVTYWDEWCTCLRNNGPWAAELPPGLLQEAATQKAEQQTPPALADVQEHGQLESVDVGSFIQTSAEL